MKDYVYPSAVITEFFNGSAWVDISEYVVSDILGDGGFATSDPSDFTATLGRSEFDLNNDGELFTVYGGDTVRGFNTLTGWGRGAKVRHRIVFDAYDEEFWFGFVLEIVSDDGTWGDQRAHVTCLDWIDTASRYPMKRSEILTDKTMAEGIQSIVDRISVPPEGVDADSSTYTLEAIFDNVRGKTKAIGEIDKLARSELGRVYILKDGFLRVEGETSRKGTTPLTQVPLVGNNALLVSDGNALLVSNDNALLVEGSEEANLSLASEKLDLRMANQLWNDAYIRTYPTRTDTSYQVLFQIGTPITIAAGAEIELIGNYADPNGGLPINGTLMQTPASGTDYQMFANSDGSGADLTASLTVSAEYYGDVVAYRLTSSHSSVAYITKLQARGLGVYRTSYAESHSAITGSVQAFGESAFEINQTYQTSAYGGQNYGASVLELYKNPKTRIIQARYCANLSPNQMIACMHLDIGSLIKVYDSRSGMYKWYHIVSRAFTIFLGGMIVITYGLCEHPSIASGGLNPVTVDFSGGATNPDVIDFGYLPHISGDDVESMSFAFWLYLRSTGGNDAPFFQARAFNSGWWVSTNGGSAIYLLWNNGSWYSPASSVPSGTWIHVAITHVFDPAVDPLIYLNGSSVTVTQVSPPSAQVNSAVGNRFLIGADINNGVYRYGFDGRLKDIRIYPNYVLSPTEVTTLYNGGVMDTSLVTDGLGFQGLAINSDLGNGTSLEGQQLPAGNKYFENILRMVGEPHGSPLIVNQ